MPTFKLDGNEVTCAPGHSVLDAALESGVDIPNANTIFIDQADRIDGATERLVLDTLLPEGFNKIPRVFYRFNANAVKHIEPRPYQS